MNKEFIPYEQALALKELGFDEPCFSYYLEDGTWVPASYSKESTVYPSNSDLLSEWCSAPLYQQAFRWLYQKLDIEKGVMPLDTESQQLLLKELIDKVSSKHLLV
jgi:hypothetical protein